MCSLFQHRSVGFFAAFSALLLLCLGMIAACGDSTGPDDPPIAGIVKTLENGTIVEEDSLDWQPRLVESSGGGGIPIESNDFAFTPAYPNPTSASTTLRFSLPEKGEVTIWVVDKDGKKVQDIYTKDSLAVGIHTIQWQVKDDAGARLFPPGLYRVYLKILHGAKSTEVRSFGDVEVGT